eukprot:SAG22_NODE_691_length_7888_cov_6.740788_6_plen_68_part_00
MNVRVNVRRGRGRYGDAAYVAMWAQAYNSAQLDLGGAVVCAYLALVRTIQAASALGDDLGAGPRDTP